MGKRNTILIPAVMIHLPMLLSTKTTKFSSCDHLTPTTFPQKPQSFLAVTT